jgi:lipoyl(octanoyl) transferase
MSSIVQAHTASILNPQSPILVKRLGRADYAPTLLAMQQFTSARSDGTPDELWLLEHPPVYTLGLAGRDEHLPHTANGIPVVHIDRGGQITYHGPGQVVVYLLLDMKRRGLSVRPLVRLMEQAVIDLLADHGVNAVFRADAPGVYVDQAKIAALGLRIRRGCCYHGLALNVDMDLAPFRDINPCGFPGLDVTQTSDLGITASPDVMGEQLIQHLARLLTPRPT